MVDIQSEAAEIRRGQKKKERRKKEERKKKERRRKKPQGKNIMACPILNCGHNNNTAIRS